MKLLFLCRLLPLVGKSDFDSAVEKRELAKPVRKRVDIEFERLENFGIRLETYS